MITAKKLLFTAILSVILLPCCFAQTKAAHPANIPDADRLGETCAQILKMNSTEWVAYFLDQAAAAATEKPAISLRAIASYGKCYDGRTNRLAATLGKSGKGPLMGANGNFRDFERSLDDFTAKALSAVNAADDSPIAAYAHLFEKQFRYQFYQSYVQKDLLSRPLTPEESDEFSKAKNHLGEVLGLLPDAQLHSVHAAFREIFEGAPVSDVPKLELYRLAIFILAPAKDKPFAPPPF
jgi:hypothetical protein